MKKKTKSSVATEAQVKRGRGGFRPGAGRPKGSGVYGCETRAMWVPVHMAKEVHAWILEQLGRAPAGK